MNFKNSRNFEKLSPSILRHSPYFNDPVDEVGFGRSAAQLDHVFSARFHPCEQNVEGHQNCSDWVQIVPESGKEKKNDKMIKKKS